VGAGGAGEAEERELMAGGKGRNGDSYKNFRQRVLSPTSRCYWCNKPLTAENATTDHFIPLACGGKNDWKNYVLACAPCNNHRPAALPAEMSIPHEDYLLTIVKDIRNSGAPITVQSFRRRMDCALPIGDGYLREFIRRIFHPEQAPACVIQAHKRVINPRWQYQFPSETRTAAKKQPAGFKLEIPAKGQTVALY
jgi:hypothetical protein